MAAKVECDHCIKRLRVNKPSFPESGIVDLSPLPHRSLDRTRLEVALVAQWLGLLIEEAQPLH